MNCHVSVDFELSANDIFDAGKRLDELLEESAERQLETAGGRALDAPGHAGDAASGRRDSARIARRASPDNGTNRAPDGRQSRQGLSCTSCWTQLSPEAGHKRMP